MPDKDDNWAGKGFGKLNEESAPKPKPERHEDAVHPWNDDDESWVWE